MNERTEQNLRRCSLTVHFSSQSEVSYIVLQFISKKFENIADHAMPCKYHDSSIFASYTHQKLNALQTTFLRLRVPSPPSLLFVHPSLVRPTQMHRWEHLQQIKTNCTPQIHTNCWRPTGEHMQTWDCVIPNKTMR